MRVAVCIATFRRTGLLRELLHALDALTFRRIPAPHVSIVVVDNDPSASAHATVATHRCRRFPVLYLHEPQPGISFARNTALEHARTADFVVFLDDDESPSPLWLENLLITQQAYQAPIVAGAVIPRFEITPPLWLFRAAQLGRKRHHTGTELQSASTSNVLIRADVLRRLQPHWFDPRFAHSGGEDTHFFRRALTLGFRIVWCDDAIVHERVPRARTHPAYLVQRARNGANHWTRVELDLHHDFTKHAHRFLVGVARIVQGASLHLASALFSRRGRVRAQLLLAEGLGNLDAFFGRHYTPYGAAER